MKKSKEFAEALTSSFAPAAYVLNETERRPYEIDWRKLVDQPAEAVLFPSTTQEVSDMVKLCQKHKLAIVPQGGRTGLVAGAVPVQGIPQVIINTRRLNQIRNIDAINNTVELESGVILQTAQEAATAIDRTFPLSLASEGSCQIGGTIATNAGGIHVLSYGSMREQVLGLEVVLPDGRIWNGLRRLRKENIGMDIKQLFIGSEGTMGIITAAAIRLLPRPKKTLTMLAAVKAPDFALETFVRIQNLCGADLTSCEYFTAEGLKLLIDHIPQTALPFTDNHPAYVLLEVMSLDSSADLFARLEPVLETLLADKVVNDMVVAQSENQRLALWKLREGISEAEKAAGGALKHDIAVPISVIPSFIEAVSSEIMRIAPGYKLNVFGHLGDGNLHVNIVPPEGVSLSDLYSGSNPITSCVEKNAMKAGGTFSAEHGIGQLRVSSLMDYHDSVELDLMRTIKKAIDPSWMINPGKVLSHANQTHARHR
ncbi:FAD-binding oxidoreductase [Hoeflea sp. G2-23]|uniref:FAD-binding oxidoreductase n=1 Tax=Hoeflea algicola TaxID=2983763 RepID=A0ABT3ZD38_9HYPH|nr:FAD-binding oxidoreductase [Hoeflea algicola]MCY0149654.1 FAD-binding oxidoreductase [Hoeflea algicola]